MLRFGSIVTEFSTVIHIPSVWLNCHCQYYSFRFGSIINDIFTVNCIGLFQLSSSTSFIHVWFNCHRLFHHRLGLVQLRVETEKSYCSKMSKKTIGLQAQGLFGQMLKAKGGVDVGRTEVKSDFKSASKKTFRSE